jgi:hypothetical protein
MLQRAQHNRVGRLQFPRDFFIDLYFDPHVSANLEVTKLFAHKLRSFELVPIFNQWRVFNLFFPIFFFFLSSISLISASHLLRL